MPFIELPDNEWSVIEEGIYEFTVTEVDYDEKFGKLILKFKTKDGKYHSEFFSLKNGKSKNEAALKAFANTARRILGDFSVKGIDPEDLVGKVFTARIEHTESEDGEKKYAHLKDIKAGAKEEEEEEEEVSTDSDIAEWLD